MQDNDKPKFAFLDLKATYDECSKEIKIAVENFFKSGNYILGAEVQSFENEFAQYCNAQNCIGVANGLDALVILLRALGVSENDNVIVPSNTYIATALAVSAVGAKPIFCEPDEDTYNLCPKNLKLILKTSKVKAVIAVHLYGQMANITKIKQVTDEEGILLIEDAAQAHGSTHMGKKAGSESDGAAYSFYPSKNLGAFGDAGAIVCNSDITSNKCKIIRNYGSEKKYYNSVKGLNSRLDEFHAAILRIKLRYLDLWNERRNDIAKFYLSQIEALGSPIKLPQVDSDNNHVWHQFIVRTNIRDNFIEHLNNKGIPTSIHYPVPPFSQECYKHEYINDFPLATKISNEIISLPIGPHLKLEQAQIVVEAISQCKFV